MQPENGGLGVFAHEYGQFDRVRCAVAEDGGGLVLDHAQHHPLALRVAHHAQTLPK
ncbi:hypothetical protein ACWEWX_34355 [Streptomyces asiaticus]